jgi:hypothetical protein
MPAFAGMTSRGGKSRKTAIPHAVTPAKAGGHGSFDVRLAPEDRGVVGAGLRRHDVAWGNSVTPTRLLSSLSTRTPPPLRRQGSTAPSACRRSSHFEVSWVPAFAGMTSSDVQPRARSYRMPDLQEGSRGRPPGRKAPESARGGQPLHAARHSPQPMRSSFLRSVAGQVSESGWPAAGTVAGRGGGSTTVPGIGCCTGAGAGCASPCARAPWTGAQHARPKAKAAILAPDRINSLYPESGSQTCVIPTTVHANH